MFQAEDGIRDLVRSRGLGDVYKRQENVLLVATEPNRRLPVEAQRPFSQFMLRGDRFKICLLYTSDAADERSSVDLGGRRIIKKKHSTVIRQASTITDPSNTMALL